MALAWKAGWVNALAGSNPASSAINALDVLTCERHGYLGGMKTLQGGLVADPAEPTQIARRFGDANTSRGEDRRDWDLEVISEPFTVACEDVETALSRLADRARERGCALTIAAGTCCASSSAACATPPRRTATGCPCLAAVAVRACCWGWCSPTARGYWCPGSRPRLSQ